jgi:hypothetical protein
MKADTCGAVLPSAEARRQRMRRERMNGWASSTDAARTDQRMGVDGPSLRELRRKPLADARRQRMLRERISGWKRRQRIVIESTNVIRREIRVFAGNSLTPNASHQRTFVVNGL